MFNLLGCNGFVRTLILLNDERNVSGVKILNVKAKWLDKCLTEPKKLKDYHTTFSRVGMFMNELFILIKSLKEGFTQKVRVTQILACECTSQYKK